MTCRWFENPFSDPPTGQCEKDAVSTVDRIPYCGTHAARVYDRAQKIDGKRLVIIERIK